MGCASDIDESGLQGQLSFVHRLYAYSALANFALVGFWFGCTVNVEAIAHERRDVEARYRRIFSSLAFRVTPQSAFLSLSTTTPSAVREIVHASLRAIRQASAISNTNSMTALNSRLRQLSEVEKISHEGSRASNLGPWLGDSRCPRPAILCTALSN